MAELERNRLDIYDDVADDWWSGDVRWLRTLRNLVPGRLKWFDRHIDWRGQRVLDVGCAGGFMTEALTERGAALTGIDPAVEAIAAAKARAQKRGHAIRYDVGVGESLPYDDDAFDAVVCVDVLEHVGDLQQVLREIARVLKPGGVFLYDTINRNPVATLGAVIVAENLFGLLPRGTHDPAMFIRPKEMADGLTRAGLTVGPTKGLGPRGVNRRFDLVFGPLPLRTVLYMGVAWKPGERPESV